ncbi:aspartate aminotransferase family protein [Propionicicella superfundia]|uniref:aminotransferase family protein n=1 Tax=Propionicicella superfundia TaxID=348582 RepID=UPI0004191178|nr:aspartate aminotransferase family protein [Propionicicella superfundia]
MTETSTATLVASDLAHVVHPQHFVGETQTPRIWVGGHGAYLRDAAGKDYLDGLSGMWNVYLGHGRRELIDVAARQAERLSFATGYAGSLNPVTVELAETLAGITYPGIDSFYFTSGGGEATDTSIRTARYYWRALGRPGKRIVISRELSYHGSTIGSSSATGVAEFSEPFGGRLPDHTLIGSPYPYRFASTDGVSDGIAAANLLEQAILAAGPENVAAFIAEPVQGGGGGVLVPQDDYFRRIREICDTYEVLFISDDVITGFGRTGRWFGLDHWDVTPDIVQFAKGITSGYFPFGGVGFSRAIRDVLDEASSGGRWWHGYTYSGHPIGSAVALETIRIIRDEGLVERSAALGGRLLDGLRETLGDHPHVGEIRGLGLLAAVEPVQDRATKEPFAEELTVAPRIKEALYERGLATRVLDNAICLAPPLIVSESDVDRIVDTVSSAVRDVTSHGARKTGANR